METISAAESTLISKNVGIKYKDLYDFYTHHYYKDDPTSTNPKPKTNTRIKDEKLNIKGGCFYIPDNEYELFLSLYAEEVFTKKKKEYFTEFQIENGPILVDLDFRYDYEIDEKQHKRDDIVELIGGYLEEIKKIFQLEDGMEIPIYVFEKPSVNRVDDKIKNTKYTKDGIHMIIGLNTDPIIKGIIREKMMEKAAELWEDLPLTNSWNDIFDKGICIGNTVWQLYGSRKPNNERYQLIRIFKAKWMEEDEDFLYPEISLSDFDVIKNIYKLSVRYKNHIKPFMKNNFIPEYEKYKLDNNIYNTNQNHSQISIKPVRNIHLDIYNDEFLNPNIISRIKSKEELDKYVNQFLDSIQISDYNLRETHDYTMALPPSYYESGSYDKWIRVGWVLKNTDNRLLLTWLAFSSQQTNFHYSTGIPELYNKWKTFEKRIGLSKRSLMNWVKSDAYESFTKIHSKTVDYFLEKTLTMDQSCCGDTDIARVLYSLYKDRFVCSNVKGSEWYEFVKNRWRKIDSGTTLRKAISGELRDLYNSKGAGAMNVMLTNGEQKENDDGDFLKKRSAIVIGISKRLSNSNDKDRIMKEAKELFHDDEFLYKLNTNVYLLCFKNGVIDFKEKIFRKGYPEDNISMCTNIDYIPLDPQKHQKTMDEINDFMDKLFPVKELCEYMWDHLASTLIGTSTNQTFNMYIGIGQNGKSVLVNLMELVLGDYKGDVPLTLVTEKRAKVGGLTPELVELKGKRYAVMQEPSKGDKINEGIMKALTSGKDRLQARSPYMLESVSYLPQFKLVVTCNNLMEIKSNDHGTWRRIRTVPFLSLFTKNPRNDDKDKPYQYQLDEYIDEKFDSWKEVFAAMLVERAFKTNGIVKDCDTVMARSNEYRQSQDYISEFINDRIIKDPNGKIKKTDLNNEFSAWYSENYGGRCPGPKDLHEYMDKEFGRQKSQCWFGVKIDYAKNDDVDIEIDDIHEEDL